MCIRDSGGIAGSVPAGTFRANGISADLDARTVTLSGTTAEGGLTISVLHSDGAPYATTTSSSSGTWSVVLGEDYFARAGVLTGKAGSVTVRATATDPVGNESAPTTATYATRIR